jgi:mannose-6-phosphate isomerase-like protein (cupin superfamily)
MESNKATVIRSADKKGTSTANSEYVFHFSSYPTHENMSFYEGHFKNASLNKAMHYHKLMTEIFTVLKGEFFFPIADQEYVLQPNDTIIIPPLVVHGFRAKLPDSRLQFISSNIMNREAFFEGLAKIVNGETLFNEEELEAFFNRHDQYSVK